MPLFQVIHKPGLRPHRVDEIVDLTKTFGAQLLRTAEHPLAYSDLRGYRTPSYDLGDLDAIVVITLEAYPERVAVRDDLAKELALRIMGDSVWDPIEVRVQLELTAVGWSYI